jgi:imipenem/basic amino acid-specific outer membrane pore
MSNLNKGLLALTVAACLQNVAMAAPLVADQATSRGFVEDSHLNVLLRNYYWNRDGKNGGVDRRDWTQGVIANFESGFTQGTVGFGVDAYGAFALKLDGGAGTTGLGNLPVNRNGEPEDSYGKSSGALKVRVSKTVVKVGEMQPRNPLFAPGGVRVLPQTASGVSVLSSEFDNLNLDAGHFYSGTSPATTRSDGELFASYARKSASTADYIGGKYSPSSNLSLSLYGSELKDIWHQYYTGANYVLPLSNTQALNFDFSLYRTLDTGKADAGNINNTTWSLATGYTFFSAHKITLAYQKVHGNTPFDTIAFGNGAGNKGDSVWLSNAIQYSDFNAPNERSWQVRYDLNLAPYGVQGLTFMTRYVSGEGIDGSKVDSGSAYRNRYGEDGKHHELNLEAKYVVQAGPAKNLSLRLRQAWHRANTTQGEGDQNDLRLIVEYPISVF